MKNTITFETNDAVDQALTSIADQALKSGGLNMLSAVSLLRSAIVSVAISSEEIIEDSSVEEVIQNETKEG